MTSGWRAFSLFLTLWVSALACQRQGEVLAELSEKRAAVDRDLARAQGTWTVATVGDGFRVGDGLRTSANASARLSLSDGSRMSLEEKTLVRFLASPPGKKSRVLDVQAGEVALDVGSQVLELETWAGPALLEPGSRVRLRKNEDGTRFAVEIGAARLVRDGRRLEPGDALEIGIGAAVIATESVQPKASEVVALGTASDAGTPSTAPSVSAATAADAEVEQARGPDRVDLWAAPGDSLIIHDAHPPLAIGFTVTRCAGLSLLELAKKGRTTVGTGRVSGSVGPGVHRYRLRCQGDQTSFADGTLTVLADAGNRRLSTVPPSNRIDTDGRRYTILYQSVLPKLSVRWPNPPTGNAFTLVVASSGKEPRRFSTSTASYAPPNGVLGEGTHQLWFELGPERSRPTTVVIQFDNAAPTASIAAPAEGGFAPGASVSVLGTALPGWTVNVGNQQLPQDAQQRFSGQVIAPADGAAIAIRFSHPLRGVHYYLRRSSR